jgi:pimeloyl-ACP methyl ester carboxylesterase
VLGSTHELSRHPRSLWTSGPQDLYPVRLLATLDLGRCDRDDLNTFQLEVRLRSENVAGLGTGVQDRTVENTSGLARSGDPPRPRPVWARARELDLDSTRHAFTVVEPPPGRASRATDYSSAMPDEPVLLVHGFASSFERNWREPGWVDVLADEGRTVIGVDLLGHGEAEKPTDPEAYRHIERWVVDVLPPDGRVDAIGFSMGGQLILRVASKMPERFRKIVVGGVGDGVFDSRDSDNAARAVEAGVPGEGDHESAGAFARFAQAPGNVPEALAACLRRPSDPLTEEQLATVAVPVLVVLGDRDFAGPADRLLGALPDARLAPLAGADHFGTPKDFRFIDAAMAFIRD